MRTLFLKGILWINALVVITFLMPLSVQAQCFHLGQAFDCKGLPEGTSSDHFNPDGSITLSNGGVVPGNFFDTPFVAQPIINPVTPAVGANPPVVIIPVQQFTGSGNFPTTVDGQNALTFFNTAPRLGTTYNMFANYRPRTYQHWGLYKIIPGESPYQPWDGSSEILDSLEVSINKDFSDNWGLINAYRENKLKGNVNQLATYGGHNQTIRYDGIISPNWLIEGSLSRDSVPYDPEKAKQMLDQAGWTVGSDGVKAQSSSPLFYFLSTGSFGRHDIKVGDGSSFFNTGSVSHELKYGEGYKNADSKAIDYPGTTYNQEFLGGIEFEVARSVALGIRYVHRNIPPVIEDMSTDPKVYPRLGLTYDLKGNGDWVFNQSYGKYVTALANSQADSADNGPKIDINDSKRLSEAFQKILDGSDAQAAPVPELIFEEPNTSPQAEPPQNYEGVM